DTVGASVRLRSGRSCEGRAPAGHAREGAFMRKILVALAFVACVGMVACGGDDEPEDRGGGGSGGIDGTGGDGGTGGSGGSGGAGGVGGTGGATNENCGNGEIDEGEE